MKFKITLLILLAVIVWLFSFYFALGRVCAYERTKTCNSDEHPKPTIPIPSWQYLPDITPTNIPSPTITEIPSIIPTVTVIPTTTPTPTQIINNTSSNSSTNNNSAPAAVTCTSTFSAPAITSITAGTSGTLIVNWTEQDTSIDKFSIIYGLVGQPMNWGVNNISGTSRSFPLSYLPTGAFINAQVWAWKNGCAKKSKIVDPKVK